MGKISKFTKNINVTGRRYSPSHGHETGGQPPIDRPNDLSRAPNVAPGNPPLGKDPRGYFSSARKGGGVEQNQDPHTNHSRNFRLEDPPQFFGQIFWGKIFGNKNRWTAVLAPLVNIFLATHAATPPATAPSLARDIFCTQVGPPCLACLPTIHKL